MDHLMSGVRDQPGQHGETLSLLKIQKLTGYGGACLYTQLLRRLRQENPLNPGGGGCNELRLHHCTQPARATEGDCLKTNKAGYGGSPRPGGREQPDQHGETPSILKMQELARHDSVCRQSQILGRLRQENCLNPGDRGCSELTWCHCTSAWATE